MADNTIDRIADHEAFGRLLDNLARTVADTKARLSPVEPDQIAAKQQILQAALRRLEAVVEAADSLPEALAVTGRSLDEILAQSVPLLGDVIELRESVPGLAEMSAQDARSMFKRLLDRDEIRARVLSPLRDGDLEDNNICKEQLVLAVVEILIGLLTEIAVDIWLFKTGKVAQKVAIGIFLFEFLLFVLGVANAVLAYEDCIQARS